MYNIGTLNKISEVGLSHLTSNYAIVDDVNSANGIIVRSADMHEMDFSGSLLAVARAGAGVNNIPLDKCADAGIVAFNTPGANSNAVKELVIAGMFLAARNIGAGMNWASTLTENVAKQVEKGKSNFAGTEVLGKTLGVIGMGAIGLKVANAASHIGMNVISYDPYATEEALAIADEKITITDDLSALYAASDFISLNVPALESTNKMINANSIAKLKDGVIILNFSRDKLVDDEAILSSLESGKVRAYVTDFPNDTVINKKGVIAIPHLGASTEEAEDNCATMAVNQLMNYIENGNIVNSVNFAKCVLEKNDAATARVSILSKCGCDCEQDKSASFTDAIKAAGGTVLDITTSAKGDYFAGIANITGDVTEAAILDALGCCGIRVRVLA